MEHKKNMSKNAKVVLKPDFSEHTPESGRKKDESNSERHGRARL